jgi:hypothetical protein
LAGILTLKSEPGEKMSKTLTICTLLLAAMGAIVISGAAQEDKSKRPSPPATATCRFGDNKTITVDYSSPQMKGRKIYGGLVPYDKVWRLGANEATTFVTDADLIIGGTAVPAGSYTIFAIPNADKWELIISKTTGEWGTKYSGEANDLVRVNMQVAQLSTSVENFTISFERNDSGCIMAVDWDSTRASVKISEKK